MAKIVIGDGTLVLLLLYRPAQTSDNQLNSFARKFFRLAIPTPPAQWHQLDKNTGALFNLGKIIDVGHPHQGSNDSQ